MSAKFPRGGGGGYDHLADTLIFKLNVSGSHPKSLSFFISSLVCQHFQTSSPLKLLGRLKPNFIWSLLVMGERKFVQTVLVTWPSWPPRPYMVKTLKNILLQNQKADNLEPWYAASGAQVLPSLFKWWPWVDLDLFYGKVKFGPLCFVWEKGKTMDFRKLL